jgi:hypothetical protein
MGRVDGLRGEQTPELDEAEREVSSESVFRAPGMGPTVYPYRT